MTAPWVALLEKVLRQSAALPDALCRNRSDLFDVEHHDPDEREYATGRAAELCSRCPELAACSEWLDSLPRSRRPGGVVAGQVPPAPKPAGRPKAAL